MKWAVVLLGFVLFLGACSTKKEEKTEIKVTVRKYGMADGKEVNLYTFTNTNGMTAKITNYGAIVQSLTAPDKNGKYEDVTLGYDKLEDYINDKSYFGCIVGRFGNRIAKGKFMLDGKEYTLATNNGPNHLHGGIKGFNKVVWDAEIVKGKDFGGLKLTYLSKDGEEGYPGNLNCTVIYTLTDQNELRIEYKATTDKPTPVNLTHHSYFNLSGNGKQNILNQELWINADYYTPVDETLIPTGEIAPVKGTPFDFTKPTAIGARINEKNTQLEYGHGYDHNWVLNDADGSLKLQASLYDPASGRLMEIYTQEPGLQFYSGNFLDGSITGKYGVKYTRNYCAVLETQHFPDSPNQPDFPSVILKPGQTYHTETVYKFLTK
ncbi:MAG TPA: galactose mutarotase [Caldithrix abyssi]|uniref:Aldose 1-epimerase n=1 Tax=Caldithrix abyssi TaxID=187145 RepID=A0A7V4U2S0_CALAY|nr:galactose mutarotase [Caldithrix abyssi]